MSSDSAAEHKFVPPARLIRVPEDMDAWYQSQAYHEFLSFIHILNKSVKRKSNCDPLAVPPSPVIGKLEAMLERFSSWVDEIKPIDQPQRFGNKAFKKWKNKLDENSTDIIKELLTDGLEGAEKELGPYLREGFGNATRIDYGTGHEFKFMAFLLCLMKMRVIPEQDSAAVVTKIVKKYLDLTRKLQTVYRMEPAGSHGVWGLDDFQFLPFIWGSSQLIDNPKLKPSSFLDKDLAHYYANEFIFMGCIDFIHTVKTGPFAEHSNILWGISAVHDWNKVNSGLIKMYQDEVLRKFPVIQHFAFGSLLSLEKLDQGS